MTGTPACLHRVVKRRLNAAGCSGPRVVVKTNVSSRSTPLSQGCCRTARRCSRSSRSVVVASRKTVLTPASLFGGPTIRSPLTRVIARGCAETGRSGRGRPTAAPMASPRRSPVRSMSRNSSPSGSSSVARRKMSAWSLDHTWGRYLSGLGSSTVPAGFRRISPLFTAVARALCRVSRTRRIVLAEIGRLRASAAFWKRSRTSSMCRGRRSTSFSRPSSGTKSWSRCRR